MSPAPTPPPPPILSTEDLAAYFERLGFAPKSAEPGALRPDLETLIALHRAHALAIHFENLSIHRGELPIRLDLPSLMDKLVHRRRGGYCFEQNTLFQAVLRTVGFPVTPFEARVRMGAKSVLPRTHMVLRVDVDLDEWLADVGFGGDGLLEPVPLGGQEIEHGFRTYRVEEDSSEEAAIEGNVFLIKTLQCLGLPGSKGWVDLYVIEPQFVREVDVELANWFTSTHPESVFVKTRTVQRITPDARYALRGRTLTVVRGRDGAAPEVEVRELAEEEVDRVIRELIGLP